MIFTVLISALAITATGCSTNEPEPSAPIDPVSTPVSAEGSTFLATGYKIRMVVTPQTTATLDPLTFEVYVDSSGNGSGLLGYKDNVYDVIISGDKVYIQLSSNTIVSLSDITGHMIPASLSVANMQSLSDNGFTMVDGNVAAYKSNIDGLLFDGAYQVSDSTFDAIPVSDANSMTISSLVTTVFNAETPDVVTGDESGEDTSAEEKESYYVESPVGIKIHDVTYSITDFCNPNTYFEGQTPVGLVPEYGWNKDVRVELLHISYTSSDGRTEVMTTDGYVQALSTTSEFSWLDLHSGMDTKEVQAKLGIGLKKDELSSFVPMIEGLTAAKGKSNTFACQYGTLSIQLTVDSKTKVLSGITISNYLDFMEEGATKK